MNDGFQLVLDHIRPVAGTEAERGRLFERLMKAYFVQDPLYRDRFAQVRLWSEWATSRHDFDDADTGIDLVAEERDGGFCAIQCKCHAPGTRISAQALDSFIAASAREPFTARIFVDTEYRVNGRTPLEWLIDRYRIVRDRQSGIVNDPNGWFDDPRDLIPALRRIVQVSVETVAIIAGLPCPFAELREQSNGGRP